MQNNLSNKSDELVIAHLLNTVQELKKELEGFHIEQIVLAEKKHDPEECSRCQAIASADVVLTLHQHSIC